MQHRPIHHSPRFRSSVRHILIFFGALSAIPILGGRADAQFANGIPNLCTNPTAQTVRTGSWSDPGTWSGGQVPAVNDRVAIAPGHTVTYDRHSDADIWCINVFGQLTFRTDMATRLTVGTLSILPGGGLQIGTTGSPVSAQAEIVISDRPIDTGSDPEQYGTGLIGFGRITMHGAVKSPTFVRLAGEAGVGQSSLSLAAGVSGWRAGDRLVLPASNQANAPASYEGFWETPTVASASGAQVGLTSGLAYPHRGGRNAAGALVFLPHVGNISRNIIIRSQNPSGTRGHVLLTDRAEVDIRYVAFKDLGRTQISPLDSTVLDSGGHASHIGTNQIGRYSLHLHHLFGPASPAPNSYQYVVMGNAIDGGTKWGITIHNTHYGLVQDNVVYNAAGAGIMTEDGSETANVIQNNFVVRAWGTGHDRADERQAINDWGWEGSGIWLRGPDNIVRNNVVANANSYAVTFMMLGVGSVRVPNAPGADPRVSGHTVNMMTVPLREFSSNEFYNTHRGITTWNLGAQCCTDVFDVPVSTFLNTRMWEVGILGFYGYGENRVTFDGWVHYNDPAQLTAPHVNGSSIFFGDYIARNIIVRNADIQGMRIGVHAPIKAGDTRDIYGTAPGTVLVENSTLKNFWNIYTSSPYGVTGGGALIPARLIIARNVSFANVPGTSFNGQGQAHVFRNFTPNDGPNSNIIVSDRVVVESFNGNSGDNFEVFGNSQAGSFVIPSTPLTGTVAGMTNAQAWSQQGIAIGGAIAPCSNTRAGIVGFVCPAGSLPSLPPAPTSPTPTPTPPPPTSPSPTEPTPISPLPCTTPDPFLSLGGGTCVNGNWLPPTSPTPTPTEPTPTPTEPTPTPPPPTSTTDGTCSTPDPFLSLGGGTCVNGNWYPPGMTPPKSKGGNGGSNNDNGGPGGKGGNKPCKTSDPFVSLGGGTCVNGNWYPPGMTTPQPTGCTTPDPFVSLGGGTCIDGNWLPPTTQPPSTDAPAPAPAPAPSPTPTPTPTPTGCTTPDPFVSLGGGTCVNGSWLPPSTSSPTPPPPTTTGCTGTDPFQGLVGLVGVCIDGKWVPVQTETDTDRDGVADGKDQCPGTPVGTLVNTSGCPVTLAPAPTPPPTTTAPVVNSTITLNPNVRFQTMHRWEAVAAGGPPAWSGITDAQIAQAADIAVNDLNYTRARIEIHNGAEGSSVSSNPARYTPVNDNSDPNVLNMAAFDFSYLDHAIDRLVLPLRQKASAGGKTFHLNLLYVDHIANTPFEHWRNPAEYGEFMLAVFTHMRDKYGFVPDSIDAVNEPDNFADYAGQGDKIGRMIVAAGTRLQAAGFKVPEFAAPSVVAMGRLPEMFDQLASVPGALGFLTEISYHRYNSVVDPNDIVSRALAHGKRTAMLEKWDLDGNYALLYRDLTEVRVSSWQQSQLIDNAGCQFNQILRLNNGAVELCPNTRLIRQYTKHVRTGAQRIEATSQNPAFAPVAFINADGGYVVVVKADGTGSFSVSGLPAGTYGVFYSTPTKFDVNLSNVTIAAGQPLSTSMPEAGVLTIYKK